MPPKSKSDLVEDYYKKISEKTKDGVANANWAYNIQNTAKEDRVAELEDKVEKLEKIVNLLVNQLAPEIKA